MNSSDTGVPGIIPDLEAQAESLAGMIEDELDAEYDLVYVDYRDSLADEQVSALVRDDYETLFESVHEWEWECISDAAYDVLLDLGGIIASREFGDDAEEVLGELRAMPLWDDLRINVEQRDSGKHYRDLIRQTSAPLLRIPIGEVDEREDDWLVLLSESDDLTDSPANQDAAATILASSNGGTVYVLARVDLETIWDAGPDDTIVITDPHLLVSNPYAGDGWCEQVEGLVRVKRSDLLTDEDAPGYSWQSIAGPYLPAFDSEARVERAERGAA